MAREDGPFEYFDERTGTPGVTAQSIRSNLTDPDKNNESIVAMADTLDQDGKTAAEQVEGEIDTAIRNATDPAHVTAKDLGKNGAYALGLMRSFAESVETFDTKVSHCNWKYRTDLASAMRWAGRAAAETDDPEDDKKVTEANMGPGIESQIRSSEYVPAWNKLDGEIEALISDFNNGPSNERVRELIRQGLLPLSAATLYSGLTLSEADKTAYYQSVLGAMSPDEQKAWIEDNLDHLDPAVAHVVDPAVMEYFADEVADDIKDPENIDERTVALLGFLANEEEFATQLYESVTPDEMADAITHLNYELFGTGDTTESRTYGLQGDGEAQLALYDKFMNGAGLALATYSRSPGVDQAALAETWFDAITDDDNPENAAALTLLIREGGEQKNGVFGTEFLDKLTQDVYDWERDQDGAVWGPRAGQDGIWIRDPDKVSINQFENEYGELEYYVEGRGEATDGLANLLGGMGHSPDAALAFFTDSDGHVDNDKLEYFIGGGDGRTWDVADRSDDGDGLGEALEAAIIGHDTRTPGGTEVANKMLEQIAEYGGKADGTFSNEWHIGPEMTDSLGMILSGYTGDIYDELGGAGTEEGALHLKLPDDQLQQVLGELGRTEDKTGLETLTAAMLLQGKAETSDQIGAVVGPHTLENLNGAGLEGTQGQNGKVMGLLLQYGLDMASDEDKTEEARAAMLAKGIDIVGGFIPGASSVLGEGASEFSKSVYDALKGEGLDLLKQGVKAAPDTDAYLDNNALSLDQRIMYYGMDSVIENGYLGPQTTKFGPYEGVPEAMLIGDPPHIDPRLYDADGPDIDTTGMTPSEKADVEAAQEAWREFNESPEFDVLRGLTQQAEFMKYFIDPTL